MSLESVQPEYRQSLHEAVVHTAYAVIARSTGVVEGARRFVELAAELDEFDDEDLRFFLGLDSQTDAFPLGAVREQWSASALEREDLARLEFEQSVYPEVLEHCRNLIARLAPLAQTSPH